MKSETLAAQTRFTFLAVSLIVLMGALFYGRTVFLGILTNFDDMTYIFKNPYTDGIDLSNIKGAFTTPFVSNYAPLHILSYSLEYYLWPDHPEGYHLTNVILHILNAILVYFFIRRLTRSDSIGLVSSVIFLIHPVQLESVAWLSERKNLLSTMLFLLSFLLYLRIFPPLQGNAYPSGIKKKYGWYFCSLLFYGMALLTKSTVVILPLLLVAYHAYYTKTIPLMKAGASVAPFFILSLIFSLITLTTQSGSIVGLFEGSLLSHLWMMMYIFGRYLHLLILPVNLSFRYDVHGLSDGLQTSLLGPLVLLVCFICTAVVIFRRHSRLFYWILWFVICILPVSQIVPIVTYMNDRYLYLPMLGFSTLVAAGLEKLYEGRRTRVFRMAGILILFLIYGMLIHQRTLVWATPKTLWEDALKKAPADDLSHMKVGVFYFHEGDLDHALKEFEASARLKPKFYNYEWIGNVYGRKKAWKEAVEYYQRAYKEDPKNAMLLRNLGIALYNTGQTAGAVETLEKAIESDPGYVKPYLDLVMIYERLNAYDKEYQACQRLIREMPDKVDGYLALSGYYFQRKDRGKGLEYLDIARKKAKRSSASDGIRFDAKVQSLDMSEERN